MDRAINCLSESLLFLLSGSGLRAVLSEVLLLLPRQCQAVPERARVREAATRAEPEGVSGVGQWRSLLCRPQTPTGSLRRALSREDPSPVYVRLPMDSALATAPLASLARAASFGGVQRTLNFR